MPEIRITISYAIRIDLHQLIPGPINVLCFNNFAIWIDAMLKAQVYNFLSFLKEKWISLKWIESQL